MKKLLASLILFCVLVSAAMAAGPLVGTWLFKSKIGDRWYKDYITITAVSAKTHLVKGYITVNPECFVTGYYSGRSCFFVNDCTGLYVNGWYFEYGSYPGFAKHLGIRSGKKLHEATWHPMTAMFFPPSSTLPPVDRPKYLRNEMLKALADTVNK